MPAPPTSSYALNVNLRFDRRTALKGLGGLALSPLTVGCGPQARPLSDAIDTVVVLMMENRSFDHYLGALRLEGRTDVNGLDLSMSNPDREGRPVHVHLADQSCVADPPHSWRTSRRQWADGTNQGFVTTHAEGAGDDEGRRAMGYFDRSGLPAFYAFADHYAIADNWYASVLSSTWPNRLYSLAGQNGGYRGNEFEGDYSFANLLDRLEAADISWATYFGNLSFSWLFPRFYPEESFRPLERFFDDADAGTLPAFTMVEPVYGRSDDHPPAHPLAGQVMMASVYEALARSPQWDRCLFIITYDEHGGFFDHVPPPKAADDRADEGFDQLGFRVPSAVIGPYVKAGVASHTLYDHTSILAFVQRLWGLRPLTARDANANDLTDMLDTGRLEAVAPRTPAPSPTVVADEAEIYAPECVHSIGGFFTAPPTSGQAELERLARERGLDVDRETSKSYEALLAHARGRGLLLPRRA